MNFEADGINGYTAYPRPMTTVLLAAEPIGGALDNKDMDNNGAASSALFTGTVFFQVSFLLYTKKCYFYVAKNKMDYIKVHKSASLPDDDDHDADDADQEDCIA